MKMETENPVWLGEYVWEETPLDGGPPKPGPLPAEVLSMFRPQHCLLCGITTANMQTAYTHYESKGHFKKVIHHMREKYNALGCLKSNKEKFVPVKCDICNVELSSRIVYLQHYDGKQHAKNLKKRGFKPPVEEPPPGDAPPLPDDSTIPPLPKLGDYMCALCNVTTATRTQMEVHNNGSRHVKNVAKLADGELREFYINNGNCEPMEHDETDEVAPASDNGKTPAANSAPEGDYNGSYSAPVDPTAMQQYQQMHYGSYPQYPMYDYSAWQQMYQSYNNGQAYNGQYYSQQYPYYSAEYYNQYNQQYQEHYNQSSTEQYTEQYANPDDPGKEQPATKDTCISTVKEQSEPKINETPLPEGAKMKPLAVLPCFEANDTSDGPPGVDGPPGIDKHEEQFSNPPNFNDEEGKEKEPESPPRTLLEIIRENAKKEKRAKEDEVKDLEALDAADLPPIPGLDIAPTEGKQIITWTEGSVKEGEPVPEVNEDPLAGGVVPPPPHPLNPPIHFVPESPEPEPPKTTPPPEPEVVAQEETYQQSTDFHSQMGNLIPHYSHPPVPAYTQPSYHYPQNPPAPYGTTYISNPPVSYAQPPVASYAMMYTHMPMDHTQHYSHMVDPTQYHIPVEPPQTYVAPHRSRTPAIVATPPPILSQPTETENPLATENSQSDDKTATEDESKSASNKPKINSFFRRAAERMFKEAKQKKMKEESKKDKDPPKYTEPLKKPDEPTIVIVPPSGPKFEETVSISVANAKLEVSETDNDVGSEPGEIVDKKPKWGKPAEKTSAGLEPPKAEKKFDIGPKKILENRRRRSFRARRASASRSRSRSRSPKRRRRRSRSWSPSPEKSPVGYYQRNAYQSYYGNDTWRNDRSQFRHEEDRHRRPNDRDEFGRERKWKEEKKREDRKKKKRKSRKRSRSSSESPPRRVKEPKPPEILCKKPPSPVAKPQEPKVTDLKPVTATLMQRLKGSLPTVEKPSEKADPLAKLVEEVKNTVEVRDIVVRPDVDSDEAREVEKEEQEILKKVALIKKQLLEKDDEKPIKKKKKKDKSKRKKKRKKLSSSSESDSSSSDSSSSSSSGSSTTSSSSSTSAASEPKSKRIVESLLTKLSKQAAAGDNFDLSTLPGLVKKKKGEGKKKKKKDKKRKKKKKDKKKSSDIPLQVLSAFLTPEGTYHCKFCSVTTPAGTTFLEHLLSEKHKLMCKLITSK